MHTGTTWRLQRIDLCSGGGDASSRCHYCSNLLLLSASIARATENESVPKIIINNTKKLFLKLQSAFW